MNKVNLTGGSKSLGFSRSLCHPQCGYRQTKRSSVMLNLFQHLLALSPQQQIPKRVRDDGMYVQGDTAARIKGFTLAEVLITLAIIGVVAALTLPVLVKNYQKHQMIVQLKKAYSTINQALALSVVKNGQISEWDFRAANYQNFANQHILPFIKTTKVCGTGDGCISKTYSYPKTTTLSPKYKTLAGNITSFITADGMGVALVHTSDSGVEIHVDLDGPQKGPGPYKSTGGRDRFMFYIYPTMKGTTLAYTVTGFYNPSTGESRWDRETNMWGCRNSGYCVAILLGYDKWQIADDYPW